MSQSLNYIWNAFTSENEILLNLLLIPAGLIEAYLTLTLATLIFNINLSKRKKALFIIIYAFGSLIISTFIPAPFCVILNYVLFFLIIKLYTKMSRYKCRNY